MKGGRGIIATATRMSDCSTAGREGRTWAQTRMTSPRGDQSIALGATSCSVATALSCFGSNTFTRLDLVEWAMNGCGACAESLKMSGLGCLCVARMASVWGSRRMIKS